MPAFPLRHTRAVKQVLRLRRHFMDVAHEHPLDPPELRQARREPAAFSRLNRDIPLSRRTRPAGGLELIFISPRRGTPPMMILKFSTVILVPALAVSAPLLLATPTE